MLLWDVMNGVRLYFILPMLNIRKNYEGSTIILRACNS